MKIYISGPYTKGSQAQNVRRSIEAADQIASKGHCAVNPMLTHFWDMLFPHNYAFWMNQDLQILEMCDALYRLPGESDGADVEVEYMLKRGKPVYWNILDVPEVAA